MVHALLELSRSTLGATDEPRDGLVDVVTGDHLCASLRGRVTRLPYAIF